MRAVFAVLFCALAGGAAASALQEAIERGDVAAVREGLKSINDPNESIYAGWTPLLLAAKAPNPDVVALLIERGAKVNAKVRIILLEETALLVAADASRSDNVRLLLQHGAEVNALDQAQHTPLMRVARSDYCHEGRSMSTADQLLRAGADVNAKSRWGNTAWALALYNDIPYASELGRHKYPLSTARTEVLLHRKCKRELARRILRQGASLPPDAATLIFPFHTSNPTLHPSSATRKDKFVTLARPLPAGTHAVTITFALSGENYRGNPITLELDAKPGQVYVVDYNYSVNPMKWTAQLLRIWPE